MNTKAIWQSLLHASKHFLTPVYEKYQHICTKLIISKVKVVKLVFRQGFKTAFFSIRKVGFAVVLQYFQWFCVSFLVEVQDSAWFGGKEWVLLLSFILVLNDHCKDKLPQKYLQIIRNTS